MRLGTRIKELRRKNYLTQQKLAEYLSVSPQAVSQWETNNALPDISLIAPLCNIFQISSDDLLEIDIKNKQAKIQEYSNRFMDYAGATEKTDELRQSTIEALREGLKLYPDSILLKKQLVNVLYTNADGGPNLDEKKEMCRLCKELIEDEIDLQEKYEYIVQYCNYARFAGNCKEGKALAQMLPDSQYYKQRCLALCCEDNGERVEEIKSYIRCAWGALRDGMLLLITECDSLSEDIFVIRKKQEQINKILYDNDDFVKYEDFDEFKIAQAFYHSGYIDDAIKYLDICLKKWTENHGIDKISSLRGTEMDNTTMKKDIKLEANGFITLVNTRFKNLLTDERIIALLEKAIKLAK